MSSVVVYGLVVSIGMLLLLVALFTHEGKRGTRLADRTRRHADFIVVKSAHAIHTGLRYIGRDAFRQTAHYVFHTILSSFLALIKRFENYLRTAIRSNKTIAKNAERDSQTLSKLEEIALHKVASALTEEEKRAHKERILQGD